MTYLLGCLVFHCLLASGFFRYDQLSWIMQPGHVHVILHPLLGVPTNAASPPQKGQPNKRVERTGVWGFRLVLGIFTSGVIAVAHPQRWAALNAVSKFSVY